MVRRVKVPRWRTGDAACTGPKHRTSHARGTGAVAQVQLEARLLLGRAKRVRRDARQHYRLLRQLITARNEDEVLDLISSM